MHARHIQRKLNSVDGLRELRLEPISEVATPFYKIVGPVYLHGTPYHLETEIKVTEFNSNDEVARLGASLIAAIERATQKTA